MVVVVVVVVVVVASCNCDGDRTQHGAVGQRGRGPSVRSRDKLKLSLERSMILGTALSDVIKESNCIYLLLLGVLIQTISFLVY